MRTFISSILSLTLRGFTLLLKFGLVIVLAKYLSLEELGQFGLVLAINALAGYFIGLDFYQFSTREILASVSENRPQLIRNQFLLHFLACLVILPIIFLIVSIYLLQMKIALLTILIVLLEQFSQEIFRLLATLSRPVVANVVYFIRQGSWVPIACILIWRNGDHRSLETVLEFWIAGAFISLIVGCYYLSDLAWRNILNARIDWAWIKKGVSSSLVLLASTLLINVTIYLSRFFLSSNHYEKEVGIITFFWSIATVVQTLTYTGIIMVLYPKLISAYQCGDISLYKRLYYKMTFSSLISLVMMVLLALMLIGMVLSWIDKPEYQNSVYILPWLLASVVFYCLAQVANYALYVRHMDYQSLLTAVIAFLVCVFCHYLLVPAYGLQGAVWATFAGALTFMVMKILIISTIDSHSKRPSL